MDGLLPVLIDSCISCRTATLWTNRSKRPSNDNFQGAIGRLKRYRDSHPKGRQEARIIFFREGLDKVFRFVCPRNPAGESLIRRMEELRQEYVHLQNTTNP